jgi:polyhydroxyalkanoate synthesis repressor PhaR
MAEGIRIIKKYQNRKLYDTQDSCYVTLDGIAKMLRDNQDIVVIDNNSKEDVTALILTQVLYEQEKSHQSVLPVAILKNIIRAGSNNLFEFMQKFVMGALDGHLKARDEISLHVERLASKGDLTTDEAQTLLQQIQTMSTVYRDMIDDKIEERINQRLPEIQSGVSLGTEFQQISQRLEALESRPS